MPPLRFTLEIQRVRHFNERSIEDDRFTASNNETTEGNGSIYLVVRLASKRERRGFSAINPDHVPFNLPAAKIAVSPA